MSSLDVAAQGVPGGGDEHQGGVPGVRLHRDTGRCSRTPCHQDGRHRPHTRRSATQPSGSRIMFGSAVVWCVRCSCRWSTHRGTRSATSGRRKKRRIHYFLMSLPHSDGIFIKAYPERSATGMCRRSPSWAELYDNEDYRFPIEIIRVIDGDGFKARALDGINRELEVRLYAIDAPEGRQKYGREATNHLRNLTKVGRFWLETKNQDPHGRTRDGRQDVCHSIQRR